jgi:hypothetical protein
MDVTFTKTPGRRYLVTVERQVGPALAPRYGPGYDPHLPHDLVHFVVEAEAGLTGGVFGRLAAGDCGIFWPADPAERRRAQRRKRPPAEWERADMERSEHLAGLCLPLWYSHAGRLDKAPRSLAGFAPEELESPLVRRICARLDDVARQWEALQVGKSLALTWLHPPGRRHRSGPKRRRGHTRTTPLRGYRIDSYPIRLTHSLNADLSCFERSLSGRRIQPPSVG